MFTPLGERDWVPRWEPVMLSGVTERGTAFLTRNHEDQETVWIVTDYRPSEGRVSYARVAGGSNIGLVDVICTESAGGGTDVSVRYTLTAIAKKAQPFVDGFLDPSHFAHMIEEWHAATTAALAKGR